MKIYWGVIRIDTYQLHVKAMIYYCKIVIWMEIEKSKVLIEFLLIFRQPGDVLSFCMPVGCAGILRHFQIYPGVRRSYCYIGMQANWNRLIWLNAYRTIRSSNCGIYLATKFTIYLLKRTKGKFTCFSLSPFSNFFCQMKSNSILKNIYLQNNSFYYPFCERFGTFSLQE